MAPPSIENCVLLVILIQIVISKVSLGGQINEPDYEPDYWRDKNDPYPPMNSATSVSRDSGGDGGSAGTVTPGSNGNNVQCYCSNKGQQQKWQEPQQPQNQQQVPPVPVPIPVPIPIPASNKQNPPPSNNDNDNHKNNNNVKECSYCIIKDCKPAGCTAADNFDAAKDAKKLQDAVNGLGTKEDTLIDILTQRSDDQIEMIRQEYFKSGESLRGDIEGDTSLKMKDLLLALVTPRPLFYAEELERALDKGNTDTMIEIFTSLSDCAVRQMGSEYEKQFHKQLPKSIKKETCFDFEKFILELAKGGRDPNQDTVDVEAAKRDANELKKAGVDKWFGTDEKKFIEIFAKRSYTQLKEVLNQYDQLSKEGIEHDIEKKTDGKLEKGLLALVRNIRDQPAYFADELEDSLNTLILPGPNDNRKLIRIMRGRCGVDLGNIRDAYPNNHGGKTLQDRIAGKTVMDYERALLSMLSMKK